MPRNCAAICPDQRQVVSRLHPVPKRSNKPQRFPWQLDLMEVYSMVLLYIHIYIYEDWMSIFSQGMLLLYGLLYIIYIDTAWRCIKRERCHCMIDRSFLMCPIHNVYVYNVCRISFCRAKVNFNTAWVIMRSILVIKFLRTVSASQFDISCSLLYPKISFIAK